MIVSTRGRYALRMLVDIAQNQGDGNVALKAVAERQGISEKYLETIAKALVGAHLMRSSRGKGGGYRLVRPADQVTVGDVVRAAEGELCSVSCLGEGGIECPRRDACPTVGVWKGLDDVVASYLDGITLADLATPCPAGGDYVI